MVKDPLSRSRRFKRNRFFKRSIFFAVAILCIFGALVGFFYIPSFRITDIAIENIKTISENNLQKSANVFLSQKKWMFFPYNNFFVFFANTGSLTKKLLQEFPKIKTISFDTRFPRGITLRLEERKIWATLCNESLCFYVDRDGTLFEKSSRISGSIFFAIEDERNDAREVRDSILPQEELARIQTFLENIASETGDLFHMLHISGSPDIIEKYEATADSGWKIIFDSKTNLNVAAANFLSAYEGLLKKDMSTIDYIDLRLENKIFYKYK